MFKKIVQSISESLQSDGSIADLHLQKSHSNNLLELSMDLKRSVTFVKSLDSIKAEYEESQYDEIEKRYAKIEQSYTKDFHKIHKDFEKDINLLLQKMGKDIKKAF